jgi:hypothetical protein
MIMEHRHGSPFDRGGADAYYQRPYRPHYFKGGSYTSEEVEKPQMSRKEIKEYKDGFTEQMASGEFKEY